jgi:hypothetical protein
LVGEVIFCFFREMVGERKVAIIGAAGNRPGHAAPCPFAWIAGNGAIGRKIVSKGVNASEREAIQHHKGRLDCFVAEPAIRRAFARPVGSSQ